MSREAIQTYYRQFDEWGRLDGVCGQLELMRCLSVLEDHLPDPSRVLDVGGGPGRYAVELARRGHRVSLIDLCSHHIEMARDVVADRGLSRHVEMLHEGDACDLEIFEDDRFEAAVAFGPFYHLDDEQQRHRAAAELGRVVRSDGVAFVQFIPPLSGLARLMDRAAELPRAVTEESFREAHEQLSYRNPSDMGFQQAGYMTPGQLEALFEDVGFETVDLMSVFGLAAGRQQRLCDIQARDPELYEELAAIIEETARDPAMINTGELALWVGRRR